MDDQESEWISKSGLRLKGWTESLIKKWADPPDRLVRNPHFRSAAKMRLFLRKRIEEIELDPCFNEELKRKKRLSKKRSQKQLKVIDSKKRQLVFKVKKIEIEVEKISEESLKNRAINSYNHFRELRDFDFQPATRDSDSSFLNRIIVNYIRHHLTHYEDMIEDLYRKIGKQEAYKIIKNRTLHEISKVYPKLADECYVQTISKDDF